MTTSTLITTSDRPQNTNNNTHKPKSAKNNQSSKKIVKNTKPSNKAVNYDMTNAKQFIAPNTDQRFNQKTTFHITEGPFTIIEDMKRVACLQMFTDSCVAILPFFLDPSMFKRYQTGVRIASLRPEYFCHYFQSCGGKLTNRHQYIHCNSQTLSIRCPTFEFNGFENMPPLNCAGSYASHCFEVTQPTIVSHPLQPQYKWIEQRKFLYRIYFTKLVFICNPLTNMVSIDFEFTKDVKDLQVPNSQYEIILHQLMINHSLLFQIVNKLHF